MIRNDESNIVSGKKISETIITDAFSNLSFINFWSNCSRIVNLFKEHYVYYYEEKFYDFWSQLNNILIKQNCI